MAKYPRTLLTGRLWIIDPIGCPTETIFWSYRATVTFRFPDCGAEALIALWISSNLNRAVTRLSKSTILDAARRIAAKKSTGTLDLVPISFSSFSYVVYMLYEALRLLMPNCKMVPPFFTKSKHCSRTLG